MKKLLLNSKNYLFLFLMLASGIMMSCGGDDSSPITPGMDSKNMKFTITINNVTMDDYISFVVAGSAFNTNTIWKVNGTERPNENGISLDKQSFSGSTKTYVIESTTPLLAASLGMQFIPTTGKTITYSYKAEINGTVVKDEQNVTISNPNSHTAQYSY